MCKNFSETEAHERLSSTRETIETSAGHYCKKIFNFLFKNISLKNLAGYRKLIFTRSLGHL